MMISRDGGHPDCPRCKGSGFYLQHEGRGYYRDGSFGHNEWADCDCDPEMDADELPQPHTPTSDERSLV